MSVIRRRSAVAAVGDDSRSGRTRRRLSVRGRLARAALLVAGGTAALSLAGPLALRPFADVAGAAGDVAVGFVLDFGGARSSQVVGCVTVPDSDSGYDALAAFASQQGLSLPIYANSGLLCSINGVPASGCGVTVRGGYIYWSYFTGGTGAWTYASTGAFATVTPGDVEGWRFQNPGTGLPNDPAPRTAPDYAVLCPSTPPSTTPSSGGGGGGGGGSAAAGGRRVHGRRALRGGGGTTVAPTTSTSTSSTTTTTSTYPPTTSTTLPQTKVPGDPEVGVVNSTKSTGTSGGSGPDPLIAGGLLVGLLAVAAWTRWRKRPRTP